MVRHVAIWIGILLLAGRVNGQIGPGFGVEVNSLTGKIVKHSPRFTSPIPPLSSAVDVNFIWQTYGRRDWHQRRNFPVIGIGVTYTDYGNNRVFGRCLGIYPNIQVSLLRRRNFEWTLRLGDGLGYVTRIHSATSASDTINCAVSTHLNDFAIFMTDLRFHLNDHWRFQVGANFTHISNAAYYQPNLGVNMVGAHLGVQYFPVTARPRPLIRELPRLRDRWLGEVRFAVAHKEARAEGNPIRASYFAEGFVSRRWQGKNKLYLGIDYAYHDDIYAFLKHYGVHEGHERGHSWDGGVFLGNEFLVGRIGLIAQVGVYYHQTFLKYDDFYEKIGLNYYLLRVEKGPVKEVFLSARLLTHEIVAQLAEFGFGIGV